MHEFWTEIQAKSWGNSIDRMRDWHRRTRRLRCRVSAFLIAGFYPAIVGFSVYAGAYPTWPLFVIMCFWWHFYRQYRFHLASERLWLEAANHAQRMFVETLGQSIWHSEELDKCLTALSALNQNDWWAAKRVRIFLEWWKATRL
jgi:hypothetical protein